MLQTNCFAPCLLVFALIVNMPLLHNRANAWQMCVKVQDLAWQQMRGKVYANVIFTSHLHANSSGTNAWVYHQFTASANLVQI